MVKRRLLSLVAILGGPAVLILLLFMAIQVEPASSQVESADNFAAELVGDEVEDESSDPSQPVAAPLTEYRWPQDVLFDNGPLVNCPACGVGGADESVLQSVSLGMNVLGFGHQMASGNWVADDFEVTDAEGWLIDKITFFAYQTNSPITSTMTDTNWVIYDDDPNIGAVIASGGGLDTTGWTNIYRVAEDTTGTAVNRPIMANQVDGGGTALPTGTYWLAWQTDGLMGSGPWALPITINGVITTGNGLQSTDSGVSWAAVTDSGTFTPQGFPFVIVGTIGVPEIGVSPSELESSQPPNTQQLATLTISNTGLAPLDWIIAEDSNPVVYEPPSLDGSSVEASTLLQYRGSDVSGVASDLGSLAPDAEMLLNQLPNQSNGIFSDASCDICGPGPQSLAENFTLAGSATIHDIVIWGGYYPGDVPTPDEFTVIFHMDDAGLPGTAIYTQTSVVNVRVQTGVILFGVNEWKTTLSLNPTVQIGPGNYWVEIFNDTGFGTDDYFWEVGNPDAGGGTLTGQAFSITAPGSVWQFDPTENMAIQLLGKEETCDNPEDLPWLSVSPTSGTTSASSYSNVDVTFDSTGLGTGTYTGKLCIRSNDPDPGPGYGTELVIVPLEMIVAQPSIEIDPLSIDISQPVNTAITMPITISNTGEASLEWSIIEANGGDCQTPSNITWLTVSPDVGTTSSGSVASVDVTFDSTGLGAGTHTGNLCIHSNDPDPGPGNGTELVIVPLEMIVTQPNIEIDPLSIDISQPVNTAITMPMTISNTGDASLEWSIVEANGGDCQTPLNITWLTVSPDVGTTSSGSVASVDVTFDSTGLGAGTHTGNLCIHSNDPDPGPGNGTEMVIVPLEMIVTQPNIEIDPLSIDISQPVNTAITMPMTISNTGDASLEWSIVEANGGDCQTPYDIPWLSVVPVVGTISPGSSASVDLTFDSTDIDEGMDTGILCISSNDIDTPLIAMPVSMNVEYYSLFMPLLISAPASTARASVASAPLVGIVFLPFAYILLPIWRKYRS